MITSHHNQQLKEIRKLSQRRHWRERAGRFVAEGEDLLQAADAAGWEPVARFAAAGSGLPGIPVEERTLAAASGLASGTRALAVYQERWAAAPAGPICVHLHGVHDPGNVGAIVRSADAFAAGSVSVGPGSADPFSPKAVRASMGSVFSVPLARAEVPSELPGRVLALVASEARPLAEAAAELEAGQEVTLMVGGEREGLPAALLDAADELVRIPIRTDSLNAAMAATVALYELSRMARQ